MGFRKICVSQCHIPLQDGEVLVAHKLLKLQEIAATTQEVDSESMPHGMRATANALDIGSLARFLDDPMNSRMRKGRTRGATSHGSEEWLVGVGVLPHRFKVAPECSTGGRCHTDFALLVTFTGNNQLPLASIFNVADR